MLVRQPFIIPTDLLNNPMLTSTERASSIILKETSTFGDPSELHIVEKRKPTWHTVDDNYDCT